MVARVRIGETGSLVRHWRSGSIGRLRGLQETPVCDEVVLRYMDYSGSCVGGNRKGLCGFWGLEELSDFPGYEAGERPGTGWGGFSSL